LIHLIFTIGDIYLNISSFQKNASVGCTRGRCV